MSTKKFLNFVIVLAVGLALAGCERTKIGDITADPGRYMNKEVSVAGRVTQSSERDTEIAFGSGAGTAVAGRSIKCLVVCGPEEDHGLAKSEKIDRLERA